MVSLHSALNLTKRDLLEKRDLKKQKSFEKIERISIRNCARSAEERKTSRKAVLTDEFRPELSA
jgi:hypothetical protein